MSRFRELKLAVAMLAALHAARKNHYPSEERRDECVSEC